MASEAVFSSDFNGEITNKLNTNYKIPFKTTPNNTNSEQEASGIPLQETETFSSPLSTYDSLEPASLRPPQPQQNFPPEIRKRKLEVEPPTVYFGRDVSYPDELNELIQPLFCNLCDVKLNSLSMSKTHYSSKVHDKKITHWLTEWSKKRGEPMPKVKRFFKEGAFGPGAFHCEACDLPLTSLQHASQHYNGKKHKLVVSNISKPSGSGYYDNEGKWIRTPTKPTNKDSRFGIGESFVKPPEEVVKTPEEPEKSPDSARTCDICNISATSGQQMQMHLNGAKHAKNLKALGYPPHAEAGDTVLSSVKEAVAPTKDVSMFRTPSGNFYCEICNITLPDATILTQHLESKRHHKNLKAQEKN